MIERILKLPFLVFLTGLCGVAMLFPAGHAARIGEFATGRVFLQSGVLIFLVTVLFAVASINHAPRNTAQSHLGALVSAFVLLPLLQAFPLVFLVPDTSFFTLYFEMLSSFTTTGATSFEDPTRLSEPIHLWRAFVAWLGGLLMLVSAVAVLAPLNLGGFEVYGSSRKGTAAGINARIKPADMAARLRRFAVKIAPIYLGLTLLLALGLMISGERSLVAMVHAMSTMSTSGISTGGGISTGFRGELLVFLFLFLSASRLTFTFEGNLPSIKAIRADHEFRLALAITAILPIFLFVRHWIGAFEFNEQENATAAFQALWGAVFTTLSFLTTTGFESESWAASRNWSGLDTSGIIFLGLVVMGGGVATTAGGIKLLRVYALYRHGIRELRMLTFPSSVDGSGFSKGVSRRGTGRINRDGAYVAWMFFMLFAISTAVVMLALTLTGMGFETSLTFSISALSTTGPLVDAVLENGIGYGDIDTVARGILAAAMILGRIETLALIALLNPEFWDNR